MKSTHITTDIHVLRYDFCLFSFCLHLICPQSYHDVAVRMEPVILELEREKNDVLIIAHESILRVLYGYLMACDAMAIPKLRFPRNEIIEVCELPSFSISAAY